MGCDIHSVAQIYNDATGEWDTLGAIFPADDFEREYHRTDFVSAPFRSRNYGLFGFLAGVRNYARCAPLSDPRGLPSDFSCSPDDEDDFTCGDNHSASWLLLSELLAFDYDQSFENRRCTRQIGPSTWSGAEISEPGHGTTQTYRDLVGGKFFESMDALKAAGEPDKIRVVFWFDN